MAVEPWASAEATPEAAGMHDGTELGWIMVADRCLIAVRGFTLPPSVAMFRAMRGAGRTTLVAAALVMILSMAGLGAC